MDGDDKGTNSDFTTHPSNIDFLDDKQDTSDGNSEVEDEDVLDMHRANNRKEECGSGDERAI